MDFLGAAGRGPKKTLWVMLPLLVAGVGACGLLGFKGGPSRPFSHKTHGAEQELECSACHSLAATEDRAGMPAGIRKCMVCHESLDEKRPPERKLAALVGEEPRWSKFTQLPSEVIFSHKTHVARKISCGTCHAGIETNVSTDGSLRLDMEACVTCHVSKGAGRDCSVCHREIRQDTAPPSHRQAWLQLHGGVSRMPGGSSNQCSLCHTDQQCLKCHQEEAPRDHRGFWRLRGHGLAVQADRQRCETCHRTDSCDRCHRETPPRSHVGTWGGSQNRHCLNCHVPASLATTGCFTCHPSAAHATAPDMPPTAGHTPATNCRSCHVAGSFHLDNGDSCVVCHK